MLIYDIFGSGHYLDSKTLEVTNDISCKVIQRATVFFYGEYLCNDYVILFERNKIELFSDTVGTILSIDDGCIYNNGLKINNKLKLPNLSKDTIFLVPEASDKYGVKLHVKDLQTNRKKLIKFSDLDWVSSEGLYRLYRRRILLRG